MTKFRLLTLLACLCLSACQTISNFTPSFGYSDNEITQNIQNSFSQNAILFDTPIHVTTDHGVVLLSGYVKKIRQADVAEQLASQTKGVKSVQNNIIIRQ